MIFCFVQEELQLKRSRIYLLIRAFFAIVLIALVLPVGSYALRRSFDLGGFCLSPLGYFSNEELVRLAIASINNDEMLQVSFGGRTGYPRPQVPYASVEQFLEKNPGCCAVGWGESATAGDSSVFSALTGVGTAAVRVDFRGRFLDEAGVQHSQVLHYVSLFNSCGRQKQPWNWRRDPEPYSLR